MKKLLLIFIILFIIPLAYAELESCQDQVDVDSPCLMVTPTLACSTLNFTIYNVNTGAKVNNGSLFLINSSIYKFNFTEGEGDYIIQLCDATTREVKVKNEVVNIVIPIYLIFLIGAIVAILGEYLKNPYFFFASGLWFIITSFFTLRNNEFFGWDTLIWFIGLGFVFLIQGFFAWNRNAKEKDDRD